MFCTLCRHHFDWVSGKPLRQSTNGHYNNTKAWAKFTPTERLQTCVEQEAADLKSDSVPQSLMRAKVWNPLIEKLYTLNQTLRYLFKTKFERLVIKSAEDFMSLRVKYLRKELSQEQFIQRGLKLNAQHLQNRTNQGLLMIVLRILNDLLYQT